jgi:hypothetical protein
MKTLLLIYLVGWFISWPLIAGMAKAYFKATFPNQGHRAHREDLGFCVAWAWMASISWPAPLPLTFCMFGFGQDGWSLKP